MRLIRSGRRSRRGNTVEATAECEAFLRGRYLELAYDRDETLPAWVWLSKLAYASKRELSALAACGGRLPGRPEYECFWLALSVLSRKVLEATRDSGTSLKELQQRVLVPLELAALTEDLGPATLVKRVVAALSEERTTPRSESGVDR